MKKIILLLLLLAPSIYADADTQLILREIQQLRVDMNQRFEQVDRRFEQVDRRFEQIDKRFKQIDKRFEQVGKHLDFLQSLLYLLMGLVFVSPFIAIYLKSRQDAVTNSKFEVIQAVVFALKEASQDDPKLSKALKIAGLD